MNWERPASLGKTVEAQAANRALKIAYLVPHDETARTHAILDAVFFESYTRWCGVYTLIVPISAQAFWNDGYAGWLKKYDPDFVYSYVDLDQSFIDKIDRLGCPIAILKHDPARQEGTQQDFRWFLPRWEHYFHPVSSISLVQTPASYPRHPHEERLREPTVFTQYRSPFNRFLADNFGSGFSLQNSASPISGFFKTLCLVPVGLPDTIVAGTERCSSTLEALQAIADRRVIPIVRLAMAYSSGMPRPSAVGWTSAFRIFVGSTALDRIHFWNSRHLGDDWSDTTNAMILEPSFFEDDQLVKQLGHYLNKHNFLGQGSGPYRTEVHSSSVTADVLSNLAGKLKVHTWNSVHVATSFDAPALPSDQDLTERLHANSSDTTTIKLSEDFSKITASEPAHFVFMPPQLKGLARGQWVVDLSIQRHNNLSRYSNVVDMWTLPRRRKITRAFTDRLAKPTLGGRLALVPSCDPLAQRGNAIHNRRSYEIRLPSDETFFRHLALDFFQYPTDDLRATQPRHGYVDLAVSDKGQNLRGVISLFDHLSTAFEILTNKFWRDVLAATNEDSTRQRIFDRNKLESFVPNDRGALERLAKELQLDNIGIVRDYLLASMTDTLEYLVRSRVFYQVAHWRCRYCGYSNSRSFDSMQIRNECNVCRTEYLAPIDIEWHFELSDFVYRSLKKHCGLPVLWSLGYLQRQSHTGSFWYLPEVDVFESDQAPDRRNEIDILCVCDGAFCAVEAKQSVSTFLKKDGAVDKFVKIVELLRPDVAVLSFERYGVPEAEFDVLKASLAETSRLIRERIGPWVELKVLVAENDPRFGLFPDDLGWHGHRTRRFQ